VKPLHLSAFLEKFFKNPSQKEPLHPDRLEYIGKKRTARPKITILDYSEGRFEEKQNVTAEETFSFKEKASTTWINVDGVHEVELIQQIGAHYEIHPLVVEDIVHTTQRPKIEDHGDYLYIVAKMLSFDEKKREAQEEQVSFILGKNFVLSFQEKEGDVFERIRNRIRSSKWHHHKLKADYLLYALLDAIVDHYFVLLEHLGGEIELIEERIRKNPKPKTLDRIYRIKREIVFIRKSIWPLRDVLTQLTRNELDLIGESAQVYLRDVHDHAVQVADLIESFRDMLSGIQDLYMSSISNKMNEVMKVLTVIATLFIPPTFIAGIYGMNFDVMPELHTANGYYIVLGAMAACIGGMLVYFKIKKWL